MPTEGAVKAAGPRTRGNERRTRSAYPQPRLAGRSSCWPLPERWHAWRAGWRDRLSLAVGAWALAFVAFMMLGIAAPVDAANQRYAVEFVGRAVYATYPAAVLLAARGGAWAWRTRSRFVAGSVRACSCASRPVPVSRRVAAAGWPKIGCHGKILARRTIRVARAASAAGGSDNQKLHADDEVSGVDQQIPGKTCSRADGDCGRRGVVGVRAKADWQRGQHDGRHSCRRVRVAHGRRRVVRPVVVARARELAVDEINSRGRPARRPARSSCSSRTIRASPRKPRTPSRSSSRRTRSSRCIGEVASRRSLAAAPVCAAVSGADDHARVDQRARHARSATTSSASASSIRSRARCSPSSRTTI